MGTPEIAATVLESLAEYCEIRAVFCQPDKRAGRKGQLTPLPVKIAAQKLGIEVYQHENLRDGQALDIIKEIEPEIIIVVAYGKILPRDILDYPKYGCVNLHVSLLPNYRGAAPIQHAILNGETKTGVTAIYMNEGLDTGDIIDRVGFEIGADETASGVFEKAADAAAKLIKKVIADIEQGTAKTTQQDDAFATCAPSLTKEMGEFSWGDDAREIYNKIRALDIWPVAYFSLRDKKIKIHKARLAQGGGAAGEVLSLNPLTVAALGGVIELLEVTPQGSRLMTGKEFAAGQRIKPGDNLMQN